MAAGTITDQCICSQTPPPTPSPVPITSQGLSEQRASTSARRFQNQDELNAPQQSMATSPVSGRVHHVGQTLPRRRDGGLGSRSGRPPWR